MMKPAPQPIIILVEPQMGENIGMVARAMANFGLKELRLVNPRDGWPSLLAQAAATKAVHIVKDAMVYTTLNEAVADLHHLMATTARPREIDIPVFTPLKAIEHLTGLTRQSHKCGVMFGRERVGLYAHEVAMSSCILTFPVDPEYYSLNIAQAVLLFAYEWSGHHKDFLGRFDRLQEISEKLATKDEIEILYQRLENALDERNYFFPEHSKNAMSLKLRNLLTRMNLRDYDVKTLHGIIKTLLRQK